MILFYLLCKHFFFRYYVLVFVYILVRFCFTLSTGGGGGQAVSAAGGLRQREFILGGAL